MQILILIRNLLKSANKCVHPWRLVYNHHIETKHTYKMTSHELAKQLLEQPDVPVMVSDEGDLQEIKSLSLTEEPGFPAIRLFRI